MVERDSFWLGHIFFASPFVSQHHQHSTCFLHSVWNNVEKFRHLLGNMFENKNTSTGYGSYPFTMPTLVE
jgi:hypothetical protein